MPGNIIGPVLNTDELCQVLLLRYEIMEVSYRSLNLGGHKPQS